MRRVKGQTGMSLVEATIILLVLMLLTAVLAPSIFDYVYDAQMVKVKEDCEAIGVSVARLARDVGPCLKRVGTGDRACTMADRADLLYSDGPINAALQGVVAGAAAAQFANGNMIAATNWNNDSLAIPQSVYMGDQFTTNNVLYPTPSATMLHYTYPAMGLGWRGAYLPTPIGPDPWGRRYMVNSAFMAPATDAAGGSNHPDGGAGWNRDVFCLSAGPNQVYETAFGGNDDPRFGTVRGGDDFIYVIQGATR
jgi:type II secretory pathway pseudopilin PulG